MKWKDDAAALLTRFGFDVASFDACHKAVCKKLDSSPFRDRFLGAGGTAEQWEEEAGRSSR